MEMANTAFFSGQLEGVMVVLEALYELESSEGDEINRDWVIEKLNDFTDKILNTYFPIKNSN
jgi:hypothetical protein